MDEVKKNKGEEKVESKKLKELEKMKFDLISLQVNHSNIVFEVGSIRFAHDNTQKKCGEIENQILNLKNKIIELEKIKE